jgi:hypothetical protein
MLTRLRLAPVQNIDTAGGDVNERELFKGEVITEAGSLLNQIA